MALHTVFGAGPVGSSTALELAAAGHTVRIVTRSGSGPDHAAIEKVAADASDVAATARLSAGAAAIYNCVNPPYTTWAKDWPPVAASLLAAAEESGAVLVTMSNLYGYGPVTHPMTEDDALAATTTKGKVRARMWQDALAAHHAGRARVTEARASDFFGPGLTATSMFGDRCMPRVLAGKSVRCLGAPEVLHTYSYVPDVARTLVVLGSDERAWGRVWHVPSPEPTTFAAVVSELARLAGQPAPKVAPYPHAMLRALGLVWPLMRELEEVRYQHVAPFIMDSSAATETFGLEATPMEDALRATVAWWQRQARLAA